MGSGAVLVGTAALLSASGCVSVHAPAGEIPEGSPARVGGTRRPPLEPGHLDQLIEASWRAAGVAPAPPADDAEWARRVTLDLAGRIPTLAEAKAFRADNGGGKRSRLVDRLLASHDFADHWGDVLGDLLFGREIKPRIEREYDPRAWVVRALEENRRYDRMVYDLLTASGDIRENGATAFLVNRGRGGGGPEAVTAAAARIFLGLQIGCAQCHDHPYDQRWKQDDFFGLVAYFARTKARPEKSKSMSKSLAMLGQKTFVVFDAWRGEAMMRRPRSEAEVAVPPRFLGTPFDKRPFESRREAFARATVASDLFPKAMVGRTWAELFGRGIVEPWDDLGSENDPKHPELLTELARGFKDGGYDIKGLMRTITLSTAYARSSARAPGVSEEEGAAATRAFAQAGIRPLSPEQLFRSLLVATGVEEMGRRNGRLTDEQVDKRLAQGLKEYSFIFGDDEMAEADTFDGSMPQALLLFNGELTNHGSRLVDGGVLAEIVRGQDDPAARLEDMFLAVYDRPPSAEERQQFLDLLARQRPREARQAYEDLFFALMTSTEAITNH